MLRFGIIGPGKIAHKFAEAVAGCADVEIYAVASRDLDRAKNFAEKYKIKMTYDNYLDLINDVDVDAVYIALPHNFHAQYTDLCLRLKKAVMCEKPYALNQKDAIKTVELARENNTLFMEGMWSRFHPSFFKAKEWIEKGRIGDVKLINSSFGYYAETDLKSRIFSTDLAGGALFDVGTYCIEYSMGIANCNSAKVSGLAKIGVTGVDEVASFTMLFDNGIIANATCGVKVNTEHDCIIYGTKGKIVMEKFWDCKKANLYDEDGELVESFEDIIENGFVYEIESFRDAYNANQIENEFMPHADTIACAQVFDKLRTIWGVG